MNTSTSPSSIRLSDMRGVSRLGIDAVAGITSLVETMHANIAARPGPHEPHRVSATGTSGFVYRCVRGVAQSISLGVDGLLKQLEPQGLPATSSTRRERLLAAVNGVLGDHLMASANPLAITMTLRADIDGQPLTLSREGLAASLPQARGRVVVFAHGLCMSLPSWRRNGICYGDDLAAAGFSPLYLHYNSGRHISETGHDLASMLEQLVASWPVPVEELVLLGHSMGGLVARSACRIAEQAGHAWPQALKRMVFIGTPHHGSPVEQGGNWLDLLIGASPYTVAFTRLGKVRSAGITDLRHGYVQDEDWQGADRFAYASAPTQVCPLPAHVQCFALAATLAKDAATKPDLLGDGLVRVNSALGKHANRSRTLGIPRGHQHVVYDTTHLDLLGHEDVRHTLRKWLAKPSADQPGSGHAAA